MSDRSREQGVEMGPVSERLRAYEYPVDPETLLADYGEAEIEVGDETTTLGELLEPLNDETYDSYGEVESAIMNMVGEAAIGRKGYSDRTPPAPGEEAQAREGPEPGDDDRGQQSF